MTGLSSANTAGAGANVESASWLELESDPGLFTLLIDDFGVKGVQVEEIYDLSKPLDSSIFGFIFLFKWIERRSRRSKSSGLEPNSNYVTDANVINKMFFAHQVVPNSCATHALLSILLNCSKSRKYFDLGELLGKFQSLCEGMAPEIKGLAIGNQPKLAQAHNSFAKPESNNFKHYQSASSRRNHHYENNATSSSIASSSTFASSSTNNTPATSSSTVLTSLQTNNLNANNNSLLTSTSSSSLSYAAAHSSGLISGVNNSNNNSEIFHFICFVPINGRLYELDGLKPFPVDHGPINTNFNGFYIYDSDDAKANLSSVLLQSISCGGNGNQNATAAAQANTMNWTNKFKQIIKQRLSSFNNGPNNHEIRFNLMAVVPDKMLLLREQIDLMSANRAKISKALNDLTSNKNNNSIVDMKTDTFLVAEENESVSNQINENQNSNSSTYDQMQTSQPTMTRQLRSTNSNSSLNKSFTNKNLSPYKLNKLLNQQETKQTVKEEAVCEFCFNLLSNDLVSDLVQLQQKQQETNINNGYKLKQDLNELIENNFDLVELSKLFSIENINYYPVGENYSPLINGKNNLFIKKPASLADLKMLDTKINCEIDLDESKYNDEAEKRKKYKIEALRRKHSYDEFIVTYLKILAENGKLAEIVKNSLLTSSGSQASSTSSTNGCTISSSTLFQPPIVKKSRKK